MFHGGDMDIKKMINVFRLLQFMNGNTLYMSQNTQKSELCLEYSLFLQNYIVTLHHLIYNKVR